MPKKIVVIDDYAGVRDICAKMLSTLLKGVEVFVSTMAEEVLEEIDTDPAAVLAVFSDIGLRGDADDSGLELIADIKARWRKIPVVGMSGRPAMKAEALAAGADYFLAKPFRLKFLEAALIAIGLLMEE